MSKKVVIDEIRLCWQCGKIISVCQDRGIDGDNLLDDLSDDEYDTMSDFLH